jgi:isopentenyl phosphate kinase
MVTQPVMAALDAGLVPLVYGDVAFDAVRGGTIVSTEEVLSYLAAALPIRPSWLLLAGETAGVLDGEQSVIATITPHNLAEAAEALGGSHGADVTGGMASKVRGMLHLAEELPGLQIRIFSGCEPGNVRRVLLDPETAVGTRLAGGP